MKTIKQRRNGSPEEIQRAIRHIVSVTFHNLEGDDKPNFQWHDCATSDDGLMVRIMVEYHVTLYHRILNPHHVGVPWDRMADWVAEVRATRAAEGRTFLTVTVPNGDDPTLYGLWEIIESIDSELSKMGFVEDREEVDPVEPNSDDAHNEESEETEQTSPTISEETEKVPAAESHEELDRDEPWEQIPDHGWDRLAVRLLHAGFTDPEIAVRVARAPKTVTNRLSELRQRYPDLVPTRSDLRKRDITRTIQELG